MQESWHNVKDSNYFITKTENLKDISQDALLVAADVVELQPSIPHEAGLKALKEALDKGENKNIATNNLIRMAESVLKIIIWNLMARLNSEYLEQLLVSNLHLHALAYSLMTF